MVEERSRYSPIVTCKHCGNRGPMLVRGDVSEVEFHSEQHSVGGVIPPWEAGLVYELIKCPACQKINLASYFWHDHMDPEEMKYEVLFPSSRQGPAGLPAIVQRAYDAAQSVKGVDANAYGVLLGRVLELVCLDRKAAGNSLSRQLNDLANRGEIPAKLVGVANGLRGLRNIGAHPALGELSESEVPILEGLTRAMLEYVYTAPLLASQAEASLAQLKSKQRSKKSTNRGT